ncbi:MAG TPA: hypothetical protein VGH19_02170 [Verrucomicrobiae bacterium]
MAKAVTSFIKRRQTNTLVLLIAGIALLLFYHFFGFRFPRITFVSGWVLLLLMVLLTAYNGRKKLPFLPMASSETWLQIHIYAGLLAALVFGVHLRFRLPTGVFESWLALLFVLVTLSGIGGLWLSRVLPKRLTSTGQEVIFERIPFERRALQEKARKIAVDSVGKTKATTIADFYTAELDAFFTRPRYLLEHLAGSDIKFSRLLRHTVELNRFLGENGRAEMEQIIQLLHAKHRLDHHYSLQLALKLWLFIHIPLTYGLLVFSALHVALVYAFSSAAG